MIFINGVAFEKVFNIVWIVSRTAPLSGNTLAESTLNYPGLQVSPPVHENQLSKSNKLDAEAICRLCCWFYCLRL
jgi:hypothetical protein